MTSINDRFRELRDLLGETQEGFAKKIDRTRSEIKNIEYGKTSPKDEIVSAVCKTYGVDRIWLETGVGEPFKPMDRNEEIAMILGKAISGNDSARDRIIRAIAQLPDELFPYAERILEEIVENLQKEKGE